jgi:haloalkane dehalogenase
MAKKAVSTIFDFEPHYADLQGAKMHYIEQGEGRPILFLHGVPTSSYVWRNLIPSVSEHGRCIAPDLMGMGKSDKPDVDYTIFEHIKYIENFIEALDLKDVILVMHGWGSVVGCEYAARHSDNVAGLVFYEAHLRPALDPNMIALPVQQVMSGIEAEKDPQDLITNTTYYLDRVFPQGMLRQLSDEEMLHYREPFLQAGSGKPIWQYIQDLPRGNEKNEVVTLIENYSDKLQQSDVPKLLLYAMPGFITSMETVMWAGDNLPNIEIAEVGEALHYAQETNPEEMAKAIDDWLDAHFA